MHKVKKFLHVENYKIIIEFDDGKLKIIDLKDEIWGPIFEPLKDLEYFKKAKVKGGTLVWPNEADFCPDVLYKIGKNIPEQKNQLNPKSRKSRTTKKTQFKYQAAAKAKKLSKKAKN